MKYRIEQTLHIYRHDSVEFVIECPENARSAHAEMVEKLLKSHISKNGSESAGIAIVNKCIQGISAIHLPAGSKPSAAADIVLTADKYGNLWLSGRPISIEQLRREHHGQHPSVLVIPDKDVLVPVISDIIKRLEEAHFRVKLRN